MKTYFFTSKFITVLKTVIIPVVIVYFNIDNLQYLLFPLAFLFIVCLEIGKNVGYIWIYFVLSQISMVH